MNTATLNIVAQYNTVRGNRWWSINDGKASSWRWLHNGTLDIVGVCLARSTPKSSHTQHHTDDVMWVFRLAAYTSKRLLGSMVLYVAHLMVYLYVCLSARQRWWLFAWCRLVGDLIPGHAQLSGSIPLPISILCWTSPYASRKAPWTYFCALKTKWFQAWPTPNRNVSERIWSPTAMSKNKHAPNMTEKSESS